MTAEHRFVRGLLASAFLGTALLAAPSGVLAQTLEQALAQAYKTNPTLSAQRARLRAVDESVSQALAGYRPTVRATADAARQATTSRGGGTTTGTEANPKAVGLALSQPLFDATVSPAVRRAESLVESQRATLVSTEQQVLLNAANAYLTVVQDQAVLDLTINNEQVLRRQLQAAQDRFRVGEYTRTDVAQSESRLAQAVSQRVSAEGTLETSRAAYVRVIGELPGPLKAAKPRFKLPASLDELVEMAQTNNPQVVAASYGERAQLHAVDQTFGRLLPSANLSVTGSRTWDPGRTGGVELDSQDSASITARVTIPLYQAGLPEAQVREQKHTANQLRIQIEEARRQSTETAISAWQALVTARANIESFQAQVRAASIALEGVRQEAQVGSRTVLDVLNQEQELLTARVSLVRAQRQEMSAAFAVLAAIGQLTARQLGLPVQYYDAGAHYQRVRGKWFGTDISE